MGKFLDKTGVGYLWEKIVAHVTSAANGVKSTVGAYKINGKAISSNPTLTKGDLGLGNVDNTSDLDKPVSTAQQEAIEALLVSPTFTGTPKAPTAGASTNTTQIATTAFVQSVVNSKVAAADAMRFKGTIGTGGTVTALPASHKRGDTYKVATAGTYAGQKCEVGDMVICTADGTSAKDSDWSVVQTNIDGAVTGPASAVSGRVAVFDGTTGKLLKDGGFTIASNVPANAKFTDTTYGVATTSANGLMSTAMVTKLNGIATGATADSALSTEEIDEAIA